jgi:hypothetical protein
VAAVVVTASLPVPGRIYTVGAAASVQFAGAAIMIRVIRVTPPAAYSDFVWIDCYQIDHRGQATARRSVFVRYPGLIPAGVPPQSHQRPLTQTLAPSHRPQRAVAS